MPLQKNKGQLKKDAQDLNMKVNCHVNCASYDAPKEVIVAHLLEKKTVTTATLIGCYTRAE